MVAKTNGSNENQGEIQEMNRDIEALEAKLKNLIEFALPRCVATYSCSLRQNYYHEKSGMLFVDAAIAEISGDESNGISLLIKEIIPLQVHRYGASVWTKSVCVSFSTKLWTPSTRLTTIVLKVGTSIFFPQINFATMP